MAVLRCPQCSMPLTDGEAHGGACPECAAPIDAPPVPQPKRAEPESSQPHSSFGCSVFVAIVGAIILCLLPVGILFYARPVKTSPKEPYAVEPKTKDNQTTFAEAKKSPVPDPTPKKDFDAKVQKIPTDEKKSENESKKSDDLPKKSGIKKTDEAKKVEKFEKKPDPPPIPAVNRPRYANLPLLGDEAIKIDGDLSDWKDVPALKLIALERGKSTKKVVVPPAQRTGKAHVAYCSKGILIAVEVVDTSGALEYKPKPPAGDWDFWNNDAVEICIDTLNTRKDRRGEENAHQFFAFPFGNPNDPGVGGYESLILRKDGRESWKIVSHLKTGPSPMLSAGKKTATGWTLEILIPKSALRHGAIKPGQLFGFELQVDTGTNIYYHWANDDPLVRISTKPNLWGDVMFAGTDAIVEVLGADKKPAKSIAPGQPLTIRVTDADRNLDSAKKEKLNVTVVSRGGDRKTILLEETGVNSGVFVGSMATRLSTGKHEESVFEILADDVISIEYLDLFRADGERNRLLARDASGHGPLNLSLNKMSNDLHILFEDNHCIAVAKPAGLLTQGPPGVPTLEAMIKAYLKEKHHKPGNVYLGVPHRLDRPVSGVVLFARNSKSAERLAEQFRERRVTKTYWGVVEGSLEPGEGMWEDWLRKIQDEARTELTEPHAEGAKLATLSYRVLKAAEVGTLVEFQPQTGRMHQIRVQAASRGHALLGDLLYGSTRPFGPAAELPRDRIIALHARSLTFLHPLRYEPMTLIAPLPASWNELGFIRE